MEKIFESQIKEIIIKLPTHEEIFNGCLTLIEAEYLPIEEVFSEIVKNASNNDDLQFDAFNFFREYLPTGYNTNKMKSQLSDEVQLRIDLQ